MHRIVTSVLFAALATTLSLPCRADDPPGARAVSEARELFPPEVTRAILSGETPAPAGFDAAIAEELGADRLAELRKGAQPEGHENDLAALVLVRLGIRPESVARPAGKEPRGGPRHEVTGEVQVTRIESDYSVATPGKGGSFRTGQEADVALSAIGFDETGGPLLFNHPMGIDSDGKRLLVADTYNNRVLIWNSLPEGNVPPDVVLGQKDFHGNESGDEPGEMNFPVQVRTDGKRVLVADTANDRILIWNEFPAENGRPADIVLGGPRGRTGPERTASKDRPVWPWGLWTDGERIAVASTGSGTVLVWNRFPTESGQAADVLLSGGGKIGTPRTITSDGKRLIVGDHNSREPVSEHGSYFWKEFPTRDDEPYDFFMVDPKDRRGAWLRGDFDGLGRLWLLGSWLHRWDEFPESEDDVPDLSLTGYNWRSGDHTGIAIAGERMYVLVGNLNMVVGYRTLPAKADQVPDFAVGSPDIATNTLETNFIISNPVPASNGRSLFVVSDFDHKMYVWKGIPDESGAHPDFVYDIEGGGMGIALWRDTLVTAGGTAAYVWRKLPLDGEKPDLVLSGEIGGVPLQQLKGVALDDRYFYLADLQSGRIHAWEGIPSKDSKPAFSLDAEKVWRIQSDGEWLVAGTLDAHVIYAWRVEDLEDGARPHVIGRQGRNGRGPQRGKPGVNFNMVPMAFVRDGRLFVTDAPFARVLVWEKIEAALGGEEPDAILGAQDLQETRPETARDKLAYPAALWYDGSWLWVGETKFSERLLRFSPRE